MRDPEVADRMRRDVLGGRIVPKFHHIAIVELTDRGSSDCNGGVAPSLARPARNEKAQMTDQPTPPATPPSQDEQRRQLEQVIQGAMVGPTPKTYANAFGFAQTAADISMIAIMNGQPVGVVIFPYVTAKSLLADLSQILEKFEQATNQKIRTLAEVTSDMSKLLEGPASGDLNKPGT